jgi:hypothetical protein
MEPEQRIVSVGANAVRGDDGEFRCAILIEPRAKIDAQATAWGELWGRDLLEKTKILGMLEQLRDRAAAAIEAWGAREHDDACGSRS